MTTEEAPVGSVNGPSGRHLWRWGLLAVAGALAILLLGACTTGDGNLSDPSGHMTEGSDQHMNDGGSMAGGVAQPADVQDATRVVEVQTLDELAFDPAVIEVAVGDTIAFEVTNTGAVAHEFMLASEAMQDQHGDEMTGADHVMADMPHAVSLAPGETKTIAMRFLNEGELEYGCHVSGHYEGGMVGTVVARNV